MPEHHDNSPAAPDNAPPSFNPKWHDPEELRDRLNQPETSLEEIRAQTQRVMNTPPSTNLEGPLSLAVRAFIARLGPEAALARFLAVPGTGPRALSLERVRRVASGEVEPTFRMAEVVYDEAMASRLVPASAATVNGEPVPVAVQPWARPEPTYEPLPVQPWMR